MTDRLKTACPIHDLSSCHPERVIKLLYLIVSIADNVASFGCVGTVQANCTNFSQFRCCKSLGHEEVARPSFEFVRAEFFRPLPAI